MVIQVIREDQAGVERLRTHLAVYEHNTKRKRN